MSLYRRAFEKHQSFSTFISLESGIDLSSRMTVLVKSQKCRVIPRSNLCSLWNEIKLLIGKQCKPNPVKEERVGWISWALCVIKKFLVAVTRTAIFNGDWLCIVMFNCCWTVLETSLGGFCCWLICAMVFLTKRLILRDAGSSSSEEMILTVRDCACSSHLR